MSGIDMLPYYDRRGHIVEWHSNDLLIPKKVT